MLFFPIFSFKYSFDGEILHLFILYISKSFSYELIFICNQFLPLNNLRGIFGHAKCCVYKILISKFVNLMTLL